MTSISDGAIALREIRPTDSPALYRWRMDDASRPMFRSTARVTFEQHQQFLSRYFREDNDDRWFVIEANGEAVGSVALYDVAGQSAESGRLVIAPEHRGRGHADRALGLLVRYAAEAGLRTLRAEILKDNQPSMRAHLAAGYRPTGNSIAPDGREFVLVTIDLRRTA